MKTCTVKVFATADGSRLVGETDPAALSLVAAPGQQRAEAQLEKYPEEEVSKFFVDTENYQAPQSNRPVALPVNSTGSITSESLVKMEKADPEKDAGTNPPPEE